MRVYVVRKWPLPGGGEVILCVGISRSKSVVTVQRAFRVKYNNDPPADLADLKTQTIAAVENIDAPMLTRVWQELEYRIDVPCHPWCTHRTSLVVKKKLFQFFL
jgi:hypothetical protein